MSADPTPAQMADALRVEPIEWVDAECRNPSCRGRAKGGPGFTVRVRKGDEARAECNECFCK